ncbi:MAG: hypothetical protein IT200_13805 [Thermoleophilia bacterium]|nr:hypothetical protein [Thermoleophilia bacterium]
MSTSFDSMQAASGRPQARSWVREAEHRGGLSRYVQVTKDHWRLMLILVGLVLGAALLAVAVSSKEYKAEALLSVSPVSTDDPRFEGINVIRVTSVPGRDVETLARLVKTIPVARAAAATDGVGGDPAVLLSRITVSPVGGSFLVSVTASAPTGEEAAALANAFAQGTIAVRSAAFREQVEGRIDAVNAQLSSSALGAGTREQLNTRLDQLQALRASDDPSIQLETLATVPESPDAPPLPLIIAIALVVGGIVAFAGAVAVDTASSRVRTEGQLSERFNLPVLARVPKPAAGQAALADAYRDLAQSIAVSRRDPDRPRALLFTSAGDDEGCTTAAVEAARTLADAGQRVLLVDADLRQPTIARGFNLTPRYGTGSVLLGDIPLERAVQDVPGFRGALGVIGGDDPDSAAAAVSLSPAQVTRMVNAATGHADFVIFDGAPLGTVADAAPVANAVDDVVIVVRRGETELSRLNRLTEVLLRYDVAPSGLCLVDWSQHASERAAGGSLHRGSKGEEDRLPRPARPSRERVRARDEERPRRREPAAAEAGAARRGQEAAAAPVAERPASPPAPARPAPEASAAEADPSRPSLRELRQQIEEARAADQAREEAAQVVAPAPVAPAVAETPEPAAAAAEDASQRVTQVTALRDAVTRPEPEVSADEPEPVAVEESEPAAVEEPEPAAVEEPEPVAVEEPEPVAEAEAPAAEPEPEAAPAAEPEASEDPEATDDDAGDADEDDGDDADEDDPGAQDAASGAAGNGAAGRVSGARSRPASRTARNPRRRKTPPRR